MLQLAGTRRLAGDTLLPRHGPPENVVQCWGAWVVRIPVRACSGHRRASGINYTVCGRKYGSVRREEGNRANTE